MAPVSTVINDTKKIYATLSLLALLSGLLGSFVYPFVWKTNIDRDLEQAKRDIQTLKDSRDNTHEIVIELKINLRHFMNIQGVEYIENSNPQLPNKKD